VSHSQYPLPMEAYGQYYGPLIVYTARLGPEFNAGMCARHTQCVRVCWGGG
jgi:hypothetical protein